MSGDTLTAYRRNGHAGAYTPSPATDASDAERAVIGAMLLGGVDDERLRPEHFGDERCRRTFDAIIDMRADGAAIDAVTLRRELLSRGWAPGDGWEAFLRETMEAVPHTFHLDSYTTQTIDAWRRREIISTARQVSIAAGDPTVDVADIESHFFDALAVDDTSLLSTPVSLAKLLQTHRDLRSPIIHGIARAGEIVSFVAPTKVGKSWGAKDLALAVTTGRPWLDRFETVAGNVLYIDNELHLETLVHRFRSVTYARSLSTEDCAGRIDILTLRGRLIDIHGLSAMLRRVEPGTYSIIILDALYRFLPAGVSENDNANMAAVYNELDAIADRMQGGIVSIHHSSKGDQSGKSITDVGSGAGSLSRAADSHLIIRPHETKDCYVLDAAVRSWAPVDPLVLRWEFPIWVPADELDPANLRQPKGRGDSQKEAMDRQGIATLTKVMRDESDPCSRHRLRSLTGMGLDRLNKLLRTMQDAGDIKITGTETARNGEKVELFSLTV
jgi:hypothetical protein